MKPSREYLRLKLNKEIGVPFKAYLNQFLAIELLLRAGDCRLINYPKAMMFAFEYLGDAYEAESADPKINYDPIAINVDTDNLLNGVQRLAGFVLSGLDEYEVIFVFKKADRLAFLDYAELPNLYRK